MSDTEQELACLHTDIVVALMRTELLIGVAEQNSRATTKHGRLMTDIAQRESKSNIFGVSTWD